MKKWNLTAILPMVLVLFFAFGCSNENNDTGGGGINIPDGPPRVSGGDIGKDPKAIAAINSLPNPNRTVTQSLLLSEFIPALMEALGNKWWEERTRSTRSGKPAEYDRGVGKGNVKYTGFGEFSGRVEVTEVWEYAYSINSEDGYESNTLIFYDFSNSGELFLGGAVGMLETIGDGWNDKNNTQHHITQLNGTVEFRGLFTGKIVFDNIRHSYKYRHICGAGENGSCLNEVIEDRLTRGSFRIESGGTRIDLPLWLLGELWPRTNDRDYGNRQITLTMPAVPNFGNGSLSNRTGGEQVNSGNINSFFRVYREELNRDWNTMPRSVNEGNWNDESLLHGNENGYFIGKWESRWQENNAGNHRARTATVEFFDYSNSGKLFFGGGWASAGLGVYKSTSDLTFDTRDRRINGRINFNGEFRGTLEFQNFRYKYEYEYDKNAYESNSEYTVLSGSVRIGTLDVTDEYVRFVLRGEWIGDW